MVLHALVLVGPNERKPYATHTKMDTHARKHVRKTTINAGRQGVNIKGRRSARVSGLRRLLTMFFSPSVLLARGEKSVYVRSSREQVKQSCRPYVRPVKWYDVLNFVTYE